MPSLEDFRPQPQEALLSITAQAKLQEVLQAQATKKRLQERLNRAVKEITSTAGLLNESASEQKEIYRKKRAKMSANGEEIEEAEHIEYEEFQKRVAELTKKMDQSIRGVVDERTWLQSLPGVMKDVGVRTSSIGNAPDGQRQAPTQTSSQRRRHRGQVIEDGDDDEQAEHEELEGSEDEGETPTDRAINLPNQEEAPSLLLREALSTNTSSWASKSLTERYAEDNDYTGFYRAVFDAKHPEEDAPPMPHASLWFASQEGRKGASANRSRVTDEQNAAEEEDSDVEVARERISITCPITYLSLKDAWTSSKCPHSFEKSAILDMLMKSERHVPFTPEQMKELGQIRKSADRAMRAKEIRTPIIGCPVCDVSLTAEDIHPNPVLQRRINRILEAREKKENPDSDLDDDDEVDDDDARPGTQRKPVGLGSSPPRRISRHGAVVKEELARSFSRVPQTQLTDDSQASSSGSAMGQDLSDTEMEED